MEFSQARISWAILGAYFLHFMQAVLINRVNLIEQFKQLLQAKYYERKRERT